METDWRPIETAPTDGARVLVAGGTIPGVMIADYTGYVWRCDAYRVREPTHWMPLPDPPTQPQEGSDG